MSEWRPIEIAPKGEWLRVLCSDGREDNAYLGESDFWWLWGNIPVLRPEWTHWRYKAGGREMSEMVRRVAAHPAFRDELARFLLSADHVSHRFAISIARAAIAALREPTDGRCLFCGGERVYLGEEHGWGNYCQSLDGCKRVKA